MVATEVVIIAAAQDLHALSVEREVVSLGATCAILDPRVEESIQIVGCESIHGKVHFHFGGAEIGNETTVWLRRTWPRTVETAVTDPRLRGFITNEWKHALFGGLSASGCKFVNDPWKELKAQYKPWQLYQAATLGILVPETIITNEPSKVREFKKQLNSKGMRMVYKPLSPLEYHLGETRILNDVVAEADASIELAPIILQQCIERGQDVRVFIAGDFVAAASIATKHEDLIDWRLDLTVTIQQVDLPHGLESSLLNLMTALGLTTGSLDLRQAPDGKYYFLEVNPGGQFLFLEQNIKSNLSRKLAEVLVSKSIAQVS